MPRQATCAGEWIDRVYFDELAAPPFAITHETVRRVSEIRRQTREERDIIREIIELTPSHAADAIRYRIPAEQILTREALDASREAFARHHRMGAHESPTNDRIHVVQRWAMRLYGRRAFAVCFRCSGGGCTAYYIDTAKSRSTGTVCYCPNSDEPMNGKPREEFETWALEELAKTPTTEEWPPF